MAMTPFAVTLCKGTEAHRADIIDVPKRTYIIHPFLRAIRSGRAFKIGVGTGIALIDERDEIVLAGSLLLHAEGKLSIQGFELCMLWSSIFVTRVSNQLMSNISLRMVYDIRYKNAVVHGCRWYKQNVPQRGRETPHLDTREDKFLRSSAY